MKHIAKQFGLVVTGAVMILGLAAGPVGAHGSVDHGEVSSSHDAHTTGEVNNPISATLTAEDRQSRRMAQTQVVEDEAKDLLKSKRQSAKERTGTERLKACEARKKSIEKRSAKYAGAAQKHLGVFDKIFTRVQAFHDSKELEVTNYEVLVTAATEKQAAAQAAVDALKELDTEVDCAQVDPAASVAALKTAVSNTRTALKDYRTAIKDVVVALKGASTAQNTTETTEGN